MPNAGKGITAPTVDVQGSYNPYRPHLKVQGKVFAGTSVADAIAEAIKGPKARKRDLRYGVAQIGTKKEDGSYRWQMVPQKEWNHTRLQEGELLRFRFMPSGGGGGKNPLRTILSAVVAVVAIAVAVWFPPALSLAGSAATFAGGVAGMVTMGVGMALVNAIAPIKNASLSSADQNGGSSVYSVAAGSNMINKWGVVPFPMGQNRYAPPKAAAPYTDYDGNDMYLHELFCWGEAGVDGGGINVQDFKLGDTSLDVYNSGSDNGRPNVATFTWIYDPNKPYFPDYYSGYVHQDDFSLVMTNAAGWVTRTTEKRTGVIALDLNFAALCQFDANGNQQPCEVLFQLMYRYTGSGDNWVNVGGAMRYGGMSSFQQVDALQVGWNSIFVDSGGVIHYWYGQEQHPADGYMIYNFYVENVKSIYHKRDEDIITYAKCITVIEDRRSVSGVSGFEVRYGKLFSSMYEIQGTYFSNDKFYTSYMVQTGSVPKGAYITVSGNMTSTRRWTLWIECPTIGQYDVRLRRVTEDRSSNTSFQDVGYWVTMRGYSDRWPCQPKYPVLLTAMKIRASEQLNGAVGNFTGIVTREWKYYNGSSWVWGPTNKIESAFCAVLQSRACSRPCADSDIDHVALAEAANYWSYKGYTYNRVFDDSASVFERLQSICAAGNASPTFIDGKWSVLVERPRDNIVMGITAANAWGWSVKRNTVRLPNFIDVTFMNPQTWQEDTCYVATDEPAREPAVREAITLEGVAQYEQAWRLGRFHYADAKLHRRTITCTMWDEALLATRGDLVSVSQPYLIPTGLEAGRVVNFDYDPGTANILRIYTDMQVTTQAYVGRTYGIKVFLTNGQIAHALVHWNLATENYVTLVTPTAFPISKGDKFILGDYGEEDFLGVITAMKFNTDFTCNVTIQDYTPAMYRADTEPVPDFNTTITKPVTSNFAINAIPRLSNWVADSRTLVKSGNSIQAWIRFWFAPQNLPASVTTLRMCGKKATSANWEIWASAGVSEEVIMAGPLTEGIDYIWEFRYENSSGGSGNWSPEQTTYITGKTSAPLEPTGFEASLWYPNNIKCKWDESTEIDIDRYLIHLGSTLCWQGMGVSAQFTAPSKVTGKVYFGLTAVDLLGLKSPQAISELIIYPPADPDCVAGLDGMNMTIEWQDCTTSWQIDHYEVVDYTKNTTSKMNTTKFVIPSRAVGDHWFKITAFDIMGNESLSPAFFPITIAPPETPVCTAVIDGSDILIQWGEVKASFPIGKYEIITANGALLGSAKTTYFRTPAGFAGSYTYRVRAMDSAGNYGNYGECDLTYGRPGEPFVIAEVRDGRVLLSWTPPTDCPLPVDTYEVQCQSDDTDFGKMKSTQLEIPAMTAGSHTLSVRVWDTGGNAGDWGSTIFTVRAPSAVTINAQVLDNNVMLSWVPHEGTFPIASYKVYKGEVWKFAEYQFAISGVFTTLFEDSSGDYTYWVEAIDTAGNPGTPSKIMASVSQPPNYILMFDYDSPFSGTKSHFALDGEGGMIGPVRDPDETWEQNITAFGGVKDTATWQDKVTDGGPTWMEPAYLTLTDVFYSEIIDYGQELNNMRIFVTTTATWLSGEGSLHTKIETKLNATDEWTVVAEDSTSVYVKKFRYVRYTLTLDETSSGFIRITNVNLRFDVKILTDTGSVDSLATDNGPNVATDANDTGTLVDFNMEYLDVWTAEAEPYDKDAGYTALVSYLDVVQKDTGRVPQYMRVSLWDNKGTRINGRIIWKVTGI